MHDQGWGGALHPARLIHYLLDTLESRPSGRFFSACGSVRMAGAAALGAL